MFCVVYFRDPCTLWSSPQEQGEISYYICMYLGTVIACNWILLFLLSTAQLDTFIGFSQVSLTDKFFNLPFSYLERESSVLGGRALYLSAFAVSCHHGNGLT